MKQLATRIFSLALVVLFHVGLNAANEPVITVNGVLVNGPETEAVDFARISMTTAFPSGSIFYTTDGTAPSFNSKRYVGKWNITTTTTLRAIAYSSTLQESAEREPLLVKIIPTYTLTVDGGAGVVTINPQLTRYVAGTKVIVSVTDPEGRAFSSWSGTATSTNRNFEITMDRNHSLTANFSWVWYEPNIEVLGQGKLLQLPKRPLGPSDSLSCDLGIVMAIPDEGYYFARWDPVPDIYGWAYSGTASPSILYNSDEGSSVSAAIFAPLPEGQCTLTVLVEGSPGMVLLNPAKNVFTKGESVRLTAHGVMNRCEYVGLASYAFMGWTGAIESTDQEVEIVMDGNKTITAHFQEKIRWIKDNGGTSPGISPGGLIYVSNGPGYGYRVLNPNGQVVAAEGIEVSPISLDTEGNSYFNGGDAVISKTAENAARWSVPRNDFSWSHDFEWPPVAVGATKVYADVDYSEGVEGILAIWKTGAIAWRLPGYTNVILDSRENIYAWHGANLAAIDQAGNVRWERAVPPRSIRAIGGTDRLYVAGGMLLKVFNSEGEVLREQALPAEVLPDYPVIDAEENLYIPLTNGIIALTANGEIKWRGNHRLKGLLLGQDGTLFGNNEPDLKALDSRTGALLWNLNVINVTRTGFGRIGSPALSHDGTMYLGLLDGSHFAEPSALVAVNVGTVLADAPWPKYRANARNSGKMEWPGKLRLISRVEAGQVKLGFTNNIREAEIQASNDLTNWSVLATVPAGSEAEVQLQEGFKFFRAVRKPW